MTWVVMLGVGIGSFVFRLGPLLALQHRTLSATGDRVSRHAGTAAMAALVAMSTKHSAASGPAIPTLLAIGVATGLAVRGASMLRLVVCGGSIYAATILATGLFWR